MSVIIQSLTGAQLGKYELKEKLGQGGMATVYRAVDTVLGREVAIKVMHPFIAERSEASGRFEREARAVAGLRHHNILAVHDYAPATAEHPAYLVMELLTGPSLQRFMVDHGAPLAEVAAMLGLRVAEALSAAHARGIIHRDVKPENVMFDRSAGAAASSARAASVRLVLCDFGIARVAAGDGMTATGTLLGSPAYMSPEQAAGGEIDARSDQFSLGSMLYQLATGALPFSALTPLSTMAKIMRGDYVPVSEKNPRVPPYLERAIDRLLKLDPAARFASVDACVEALRLGLADDGLGDVDAELAAYVAAPASYNQAVQPRLVEATRLQARRAAGRGETARALAAANRLLQWEPRDAEALALARGLARRPRLRVLAVATVVALALAAGGLTLRHRRAASPAVTWLPTSALPSPPPVAPAPSPPPVAPAQPSPSPEKMATAAVPPSSRVHKLHATPPSSPAVAVVPSPPPLPSPPTPAPAAPPAPAPVAADAPATLTVAIAPWCDLTVDGNPRGRTPQSLSLSPGLHSLVCRNPSSGQELRRELRLAAGETRELRERLYATVRLTARLRRGDAFSVDGGAAGDGARELEPGRRRVTLYAKGRELETRYVDVPPGGCVLIDAPELACEKP